MKTTVELVTELLDKAEAKKDLNCFLWQDRKTVLADAQAADDRRANGEAGRLLGVPIAIKDNLMTKGVPTTAGSKMLEGYIAPYDATVVAKLKAEGAVIVGKTNLDEYAMGSSTENSAYGTTKNPWDTSRVPGGSSGGSAAAVAAGLAPIALGTDTGGSIRLPASFCGVVGMKPTYGAVSRYGAIAMGSSLDQIGPLGRTVADVRAVLEVIAGADRFDATSVGLKPAATKAEPKGLKVGIPGEYFGEGMDAEVRASIEAAISQLAAAGAEITKISLPHTAEALATYYIIMPAEVSSNLARYDGIRYGYSVERENGAEKLLDIYKRSRSAGFGEEARRRIMLGTYVLSAGYYDAYYKKAQQVRRLVREDYLKAFETVDLLLTPVSPTPAFKLGEKMTDPLAMYLGDVNTVPVNIAGLPAISIPCGLTSNRLPIGLQLIGPHFADYFLLDAAEEIEKIIDFQEKPSQDSSS